MNLSEIIKSAILSAGGDGLCNSDAQCGCGIDDLVPCEAPNLGECCPAKSRILGDCEYVGDCGPGDVIFEAIKQ